MRRKLASVFISICMLAASVMAVQTTALAADGDEIAIKLSDSGVTVDGKSISSEPDSAVYAGEDIVYYEAGRGSSYGEGTAADEHEAAEAERHTVVTITKPGTYRVSGKLSAGQLVVDLGSDAKKNQDATVEIVLDGADITCTVAPGIIFYNVWESESTEKAGAVITLADDSENTVNGSYVARIYKEGTTSKLHKYDGAVYSKMSMIVQGEKAGTGKLVINAENEGLDSEMHLTINGGNYNITAQDDGINANEDNVSIITLNEGYLYIDAGNGAEGDGVDSNGKLFINGGTLISLANPKTGDGGIDADQDIVINGGNVIALGSRNDAASADSKQPYMELSYAATKVAGTIIRITDPNGGEIVTFKPAKAYQSFTYSSPSLALDTAYHVYSGGTVAGAVEIDGLYAKEGEYSGGVQQQYTGNVFGMGVGPGGFGDMQPPENLEAWLETADIPDDIREWIENIKDRFTRAPENAAQMPDMPAMPEEGAASSAEFIITADTHSFGNVTDYARESDKKLVTFSVNDDNGIANTVYGTPPEIEYKGVTARDGGSVSIPATDIQFTITDIPSENYLASCSLSDGADALKNIVPTEPGSYVLTIAVVDSNAEYTGSSQWEFKISEEGQSEWPFKDVAESDSANWYYSAVKYAYENGMMKGTGDMLFAPDVPVNRAVAITMLGRVANAEVDQNAQTGFEDVVNDGWSAGYIAWAANNGIASGYSSAKFGQYDNVTREQLCVMLVNYAEHAGIQLSEKVDAVTFSDSSNISDWASAAVDTCQKAGLVQGSEGNRFNPKEYVTRAEAAAIFMRFAENFIK